MNAKPVFAFAFALVISALAAEPGMASHANPGVRVSERTTSHGFSALVFSKTVGFRHESIPAGIAAIEALGIEHDFDVTSTEDASVFNETSLASYDVVIFLNTTGDVLNTDQQQAMESFLAAGKGFVGIHAAADTEYGWDWYADVVGAYFDNHPEIQPAELLVEDRVHPATAHLPARWQRTDEWYAFRTNPRDDVHVLISLKEASYSGGTMGADHPWAWCGEVEGGRSFYTNGGHTSDSFSEPDFLAHLLGGIEWAAGAQSGDCGASIKENLEKTILDDTTQNPMDLVVLPSGDVLFLERAGQVRLISQETGITSTAVELNVALDNEDGLLGIVLDPDFNQNGWVYLFYSPAGTVLQKVSRFTFDGSLLDPASEVNILQFEVDRNECCHSAGSMAFDADGHLFIATGDNTNPFASDGYAPLDDRAGRAPWDARRTSGNTNDLRGKILRIIPGDEGGYTIPEGNLFPEGTAFTRPEIYVMGVRNPFRIALDTQNGALFWGDVGPDAESDNGVRGPRGYDEWNRATDAGNYGWPFCVADNKPYTDWDFASGTYSGLFDCAAPENTSAFNTGLTTLPPSQPAWIYYPYGVSAEFPAITEGPGRTAIAGPVYRPSSVDVSGALPPYFSGSFFIGEWTRSWLKRVILDDDGGVLRILPFADQYDYLRPIALKMGPDGAFYGIEWGSGFGGNNADSRIFRISYEKGNRAPVVQVNTSDLAGGVPLEVSFNASQSTDSDPGDQLTFSWDFTNDGSVDATGPVASYVYEEAGDYTAVLEVRDTFDNVVTRSFAVRAGNESPIVTTNLPLAGTLFSWGDTLTVSVSVTDLEDGSTEDGSIDCALVESQPFIGHDEHAHPLDVYTGCDIQIVTPDGHGSPGDRIFLYLESRYQDTGSNAVSSAQGRTETLLFPRTWEAEHVDDASGIELEDSADPTGGRRHLAYIDHGDWVLYRGRNLSGVSHITFRVASAGSGGTISLRQGGPTGRLLGRTHVPITGGWQTFVDVTMAIEAPEETMDMALVFENAQSGAGLFNINRMLFEGPAFVGDGEAWGLRADLFASADWTGDAVEEIHPGLSWFWSDATPIPGSAARPFSARWQGRLIAPNSGSLRLYAQTWGTLTLALDGSTAIEVLSEGSSPAEASRLLRVTEGQVLDLDVAYSDAVGDAGLILSWEGTNLVRQTIQMSDTRLPVVSGTLTEEDGLPSENGLVAAFPNPFQHSLNVRVACEAGTPVETFLVDVLGRRRQMGAMPCSAQGEILFEVDTSELSSGVYFVVVRSSTDVRTLPVTKL